MSFKELVQFICINKLYVHTIVYSIPSLFSYCPYDQQRELHFPFLLLGPLFLFCGQSGKRCVHFIYLLILWNFFPATISLNYSLNLIIYFLLFAIGLNYSSLSSFPKQMLGFLTLELLFSYTHLSQKLPCEHCFCYLLQNQYVVSSFCSLKNSL